jgi:predicted RNase H-like HicB family nuclease
MKMYDVIVERRNGIYHASAPALPGISVEGSSRDEAIVKAKEAIEDFFKSAEVTTIAVEVPASEYSFADRWIHQAGIQRQDPADPLYQEYLAELAREKQRQREEAEGEADAEPLGRNRQNPDLDRRSPRVWLETAGMFVGDEEAMWRHIEEIEAERKRQREEVEREYDLLEAKGEGG